ncbi:MAG: leucyl/phenylalanyl-tRNA--protein transferase [Acidobacteriota bacterium]
MPIFRLPAEPLFPDPELAEDEGLLAIGGDLSPERLVTAYSLGIFPWYGQDEPILWWSPDPRLVLLPERLHVSRSLRRTLRRERYAVTLDEAFSDVVAACAEQERPGQNGTWITDDMHRAYVRLHEIGLAHSVEVWDDDALVGGVYGVCLGSIFFGESMFARATDASKVGFVRLVEQLARWGIDLIDCQVHTDHLVSLGAEEWPRKRFLAALEKALQEETRSGPWSFEPSSCPVVS